MKGFILLLSCVFAAEGLVSIVPSPSKTSKVIPSSTVKIIYDHICDMGWPCGHHGRCIKINWGYRCDCYPGYSGQHCENSPPTTPPACQCQNGGQCHYSHGHPYCSCSFPYTGQYCETHACDFIVCANGGTCVRDPHDARCVCPPNYTGQDCSLALPTLPMCDCQNGGICVDDMHGRRCICSGPYMGDKCQYKEVSVCQGHNPCHNGGSCIDGSHYGQFECRCRQGFYGRLCDYKNVTARTVPKRDQEKQRVARDVKADDEDSEELKQLCEKNKLKAKAIFSDEPLSDEKWNSLHPAIKEVLTDVVANDDHKMLWSTHAQIKKAVAGNDLRKMSRIMAKRGMWKEVPLTRYWKRKRMMKKAVKDPWSSLIQNESC